MPLNDPVPSNAIDVLDRNAEDIDRAVNSAAHTLTNRVGASRYTLAGLEQLVRDITSPATDFWLEPSASDPATGYDGVALQAGMAYLNTTENVVRYYNGTVWNYVNHPNVILF